MRQRRTAAITETSTLTMISVLFDSSQGLLPAAAVSAAFLPASQRLRAAAGTGG